MLCKCFRDNSSKLFIVNHSSPVSGQFPDSLPSPAHAQQSIPIKDNIRFAFLFCSLVYVGIQSADMKSGINIEKARTQIVVLSLGINTVISLQTVDWEC